MQANFILFLKTEGQTITSRFLFAILHGAIFMKGEAFQLHSDFLTRRVAIYLPNVLGVVVDL